MALSFLAPYLAKNLAQIAHGQRPTNTIPNRLPFMSLVSMGPAFGIMVMNGLVTSGDNIAKGKFDVTDAYEKLCKGDQETQVQWAKQLKSI